jgi:superfamily II DNA or RNA helicase
MLDSKSSVTESSPPSLSTMLAISLLKFLFKLTKDQIEAVDAWTTNGYRGSIIYSTGTGKTEIVFECAKRAAERDHSFNRFLNIFTNIGRF